MTDYISREAFLEHLRKDPLFDLVERYGLSNVIEWFPAADVVEVVHGEWLWFEDCVNSGLYCSACHKLIHKVMRPKKKLSNYCPNCGAKMDGGADG